MQATIAEFTAHVGGKPSAPQRALIERAAWLTLHIAMLDARAIDRDGFSERDSRTYLAWSNTLARTLARLGPEVAAAHVGIRERMMQEAAADGGRAS